MTKLVVSNRKFVKRDNSLLTRVVPVFTLNILPVGEITGSNIPGTGDLVIPSTINETTVISIGDGAFTGSTFTTIVLPETLITIGNDAFDGSNITRITIPDDVTLTNTSLGTLGTSFKTFYDGNLKVGGTYIYYNSTWTDVNTFFVFDEPTNTITGYNNAGGLEVVVPASINEVPVLHIGDQAFFDKSLTSVKILEGILDIGEMAFQNNQIGNLELPSTLSAIGLSAFSGNLLTTITIPDSTWNIASMAFNANPLTTIIVPGWLNLDNDVMGDYSVEFKRDYDNYSQAAGLYNYVNGSWIRATTVVDALDFYITQPIATNTPDVEPWLNNPNQYTAAITWEPNDATFGLGIEYVATIHLTPKLGYTFIGLPADCFVIHYGNVLVPTTNPADSGEITATFPATTHFGFDTTNGTITRYGDNAPKAVSIPSTIGGLDVDVIGAWSFDNMQITSVSGLSAVSEIEGGAFMNNLISSINLPSLLYIAEQSFRLNQLTTVSIPASVLYIHSSAFADNSITSLTLQNGLLEIGSGAFGNNNLTSVTIPSTVERVDSYAFMNNPITSVTIGAGVTNLFNSPGVFGTYYNGTFYSAYTSGGAGTYTYNSGTSSWSKS